MNQLPEEMYSLFWEYDPQTLSLDRDRDLIIGRVLSAAGWDGVRWLLSEFGESALTEWILRSRGKNLSPPRLRFWELVLSLPRSQVDEWLSEPGRKIWEERTAS